MSGPRRELAERLLIRLLEPYSFSALPPELKPALIKGLAADTVALADALIKRANEAWGPEKPSQEQE